MKSKSFKNWTRQDIADEFGLKVTQKCETLDDWLNRTVSLSQEEIKTLDKLQDKLIRYVDIWNEQELIIKFIAFIVELVDFDTSLFKSFANRPLKGTIQGKAVAGEVDLMVASGDFEPKEPYFCLHEYKKEKGADNDPLGQLLIAMMTAQSLNNNDEPVYGAYVIGRNWFFLTLVNQTYCISNEFVATRKDIYKIAKIMKSLKLILQEITQMENGEKSNDEL